jgi:hypothetical protein
MTDADCGEFEHYDLDAEIEHLCRAMSPADNAYFQAILDVVHFAQAL